MGYYEKLLKINKIREAMLDEKSKILFDARIDYMITRDAEKFCDVSSSLENIWYCKEVNDVLGKIENNIIVIFGSGHDGVKTKRILEKCNYSPKFFCDSDSTKVGTKIDDLEVLAIDELLQNYNNCLVVLGSAKYAKEMYQSLLARNFPKERILYPQCGILIAQCGKQYFDMFSCTKEEVFIDGGGYIGDTLLDFLDWTDYNYEKVYVFEPIKEMLHSVEKIIKEKSLDGVELYNNGLWSKKETLQFLEAQSGSRVTETGELIVEGVSLDEVIKGEKVTFIKMDIEGSELEALKGAKNIIKKNRPRLAICIYHKPEDILEIPLYIQELVPEYKFYIRHYSSCMWETVLYAEVCK